MNRKTFYRALGPLLVGMLLFSALPAVAAQRIKDIARVQGVRSNQIYGIGLVVGLDGSGDKDLSVTRQMMENLVNRLGVNVEATDLAAGNVAAVMVTAELPPFAKPGDSITITVSSIGDAESLDGGALLQTPLQAANGKVYAVAQGSVSLGGVDRTKRQVRGTGNVRTTASIPGGATVEREVPMNFTAGTAVNIVLNAPDFTTAERVESAINNAFGPGTALAQDPATIVVTPPGDYGEHPVKFIAHLEGLEVLADAPSQIVINERTGTIVIGGDMELLPVTIAHGTLNITIQDSGASVEGPGAGAQAQRVHLANLRPDTPRPVTIRELVETLNQLGVTPKDVVSILQTLKAAGALSADIKIM